MANEASFENLNTDPWDSKSWDSEDDRQAEALYLAAYGEEHPCRPGVVTRIYDSEYDPNHESDFDEEPCAELWDVHIDLDLIYALEKIREMFRDMPSSP
jgi:hypothetical protein